jgi:RimJ/RimL family protein N-acetyltransferase
MISRIPAIETVRLLLRPFTIENAPAVHGLLAEPEISETTLNVSYPYPEGAAEAWISSHEQQAEDDQAFHWAIVRNGDDLLIGAIGLGLDQRHARGSLGYWLGVPFWNLGYMSEAALAVTRHALESLSLHRVESSCFPRNSPSAKVMTNAGLTYEGTLKGYVRKGEVFEDLAMYALVAPN